MKNFVIDTRNSKEPLYVVGICDYNYNYCKYYDTIYLLQTVNNTFIERGERTLKETERTFSPKVVRKGAMIKVINPHSEWYGKKLNIRDIESNLIYVNTHKGIQELGLTSVQLLK